MKRVTLLLSIAVGLAVAAFVGLWSSNSASAGFNDGFKCYRTQNIQTQQVFRGPLIYISDQFSERNLVVKKPIAFCARANKGPGRAGTVAGNEEPSELLCYDTKDAPGQKRVPLQEVVTNDQFTSNFLVVNKPYALCEAATKGAYSGAVAGPSTNGLDFSFRCYRVRREENGERFEKISVSLFDQFERGGKDVLLGRPVVFCTQVEEKKSKAKNNHIDHAVSVDPPQEYHASTISTTNDHSDPRITCNGEQTAYGHSVWFTYTPSEDVKFDINTEYSTYDTVVAIFNGSPEADGSNQIDCNDDKDYPYSGHSHLSVKLEGYQKYYILVASFGGDAGGKLKVSFDTSAACESNLCSGGSTAAASVVDLGDVGDAAGDPVENLVCYSLSQRAPAVEDVQTEDQLTITQFAVGRGIMYCAPADKCLIVTHPLSVATNPTDQKQCAF